MSKHNFVYTFSLKKLFCTSSTIVNCFYIYCQCFCLTYKVRAFLPFSLVLDKAISAYVDTLNS